jgi:L(+)-tartrate dehydratase beta subunit
MSREWYLKTPLSDEDVRKLELLDVVYLSGKMWGIRDENLRRHLDHNQPLPDGVNYSGYPLLHEAAGYKRDGEEWVFTSGMGNTTSTRMERWMPQIIERHRCRAILGKGGLLEGTTEACRKYGCVYMSTIGGAATHYDSHARIINVYWPDLTSQAILELELKEYGPCFVSIDAHGNNHYFKQRELILKQRSEIYRKAGIGALSVAPHIIPRS